MRSEDERTLRVANAILITARVVSMIHITSIDYGIMDYGPHDLMIEKRFIATLKS